MICLAPRAPGDSVRPRRLSGASARPLNFIAEIELPSGEILSAELHWYEATGIGRREFKIKRLL